MMNTAKGKAAAVLAAGLFVGVSAAALGQAPPPAPAPAAPGATMQIQMTANRLLGKNIQDSQNNIVGFIDAVATGPDGRPESVIVGVGTTGASERSIELKFSQLKVAGDGEKITVDMTKEQLAGLPEYRYADPTQRGTAFRSTVAQAPAAPPAPPAAQPAPPRTPLAQDVPERTTPATPPASPAPTAQAANGNGALSTKNLLGMTVYGPEDTSVGSIRDIVLDGGGAAQSAVIAVGGILGFGAKEVMISWSEVRVTNEGDIRKVTIPMTADQLKAMPESREDGGVWVNNN
jgi:sporulation protein YlmC with PRC-barrel domain